MVFSSLEFLYIFMPLFFGVYYLVPAKMRNGILLMGSLCFYAVGTWMVPGHFLLFILSMSIDYFVGRGMERFARRKKLILWLGVLFHILCLGFFKYFPFIAGEISALFSGNGLSLKILLPIGISFYTFQGLSYIIDVYRGTVPAEKSALRFFVYLSMFPQLIAGPIVTYNEVRRDLSCREIRKADVSHGLGI